MMTKKTSDKNPVVTGWEQPLTDTPGTWDNITPSVDMPAATKDPALEFENATEEQSWGDSFSELTIEQHSGAFDPDIAKYLIYGESGTGKTRLASTFPNVIFADVDHGMSSVTEQVDKVYIHDNDHGFKELEAMHAFLEAGEHSYKTVVIDTLNEMQRVIMRFTIEEFTHVRRSYGNMPGMGDYGKMLYEFIELTRKFCALPMRVIFLAQVNTQQFDTDVLMPQLVGKNSAREIMRKMDIAGYVYKSDQEDPQGRKFSEITFDAVNYVTKDRSYRLPSAMLDPTYSRIAAFWK